VRSTGGADLWKRDYCRRIEGLAASRITYHEYPPGSSYEAIPKECNSAPAQAQLAERLELGYVIGHETGKQTKERLRSAESHSYISCENVTQPYEHTAPYSSFLQTVFVT